MKEEWRDIVGYEGLYKVSNFGNVYSVRSDKRLKHSKNRGGYLFVVLCTDGKQKQFKVHRLVAISFLTNPDNKPQVNHIDEDKTNNRLDNLEWVTAKENTNYGSRNKKAAKSNSKNIKVIYQDNTYEYWDSATVFAQEYGNGADKRYISAVLKGKIKSHLGLRFEYATSEEK